MFGTEVSFLDGLMIMVLGMGVTFSILYFLSLLINTLKMIFNKPPQPETPEPVEHKQVAAETTTSTSTIQENPAEQPELMAAVTAALASTLGKPPQSIAIKKIVRKDKSSQPNQPELVAAITAAIALALETLPKSIAVTKIVRVGSGNSSRWNDFAKTAQFNNRL